MSVMERKIVAIDEEKCNGCGICVDACHEGAIQMVNGKAKLVSDIYCDGLGDCLGPCPTGAISIITRNAEAYDEAAVEQRMLAKKASSPVPAPSAGPLPCGCPGTMSRSLKPDASPAAASDPVHACACDGGDCGGTSQQSELMNWPVQLRLVPPGAPYLQGADILLAADCTALAVPDFHSRYLRNRPVVIACPKLEDNDPQIAKLADIVRTAKPASITVLRMEVPCCGGLVRVAEAAVQAAGTGTPVMTVVVGVDGRER